LTTHCIRHRAVILLVIFNIIQRNNVKKLESSLNYCESEKQDLENKLEDCQYQLSENEENIEQCNRNNRILRNQLDDCEMAKVKH